MKIALSKPLLVAGEEVKELQLRDEATCGDIWDVTPPISAAGTFAPPSFGDVLRVAARLAGVPEDVIRGLPARDAQAIYGAVLPLVFGGRADGSAPPGSSSSTAA